LSYGAAYQGSMLDSLSLSIRPFIHQSAVSGSENCHLPGIDIKNKAGKFHYNYEMSKYDEGVY
jgi:hypothetical protein